MAIYHLTAKTGSRKNGQSAKAKADYIQREGRYSRDPDEVLHTRSGNMPEWASDQPTAYWDSADLYERANGRLFKEVEFALPVELSLEQQQALADQFAQQLTEAENLPYTLAIHKGGGTNPHCHLMISERKNDGVQRPANQWFKRYNAKQPERGGAQKSEALKPKVWLEQTRQDWASLANEALELAAHDARIDHRTLEAQGIERIPGLHLGPHVLEMEDKGIRTDRAELHLVISDGNDTIRELETHREAIEHERDRAIEESQRDRRAGRTDRTTGPEPGGLVRGGPEPDQRDRAVERAAGSELGGRPEADSDRVATNGPTDADGRRASDPSKQEGRAGINRLDMAALGRSLDRLRDAYSGAFDRIMALAGPNRGNDGGRNIPVPEDRLKSDRTVQAIGRQLKAMGCDSYEIGIREAATGKMMNRHWWPGEIRQNLGWIKRMNAMGNDIYIRPAREERHGLVLLDDLAQDDLVALKQDGNQPALVVETSPENYQAWVKVADDVTADRRGIIARHLSDKYDADRASAGAYHYGRLVGFTNRKDKYASRQGYQPWVLCRESTGVTSEAGPELLQLAAQQIEAQQRQQELAQRLEAISIPPKHFERSCVDDYRREMAGLVKRFGDDLSKCDYIAATTLAKRGRDPDEIVQAIIEASPGIMDRKAGHESDYAQRTVAAVLRAPEVQEARISLVTKQSRPGWGMSR